MSERRAQPPARVLIVDDDQRYSDWLRHHLEVLCPQASVSLLNLAEFERWCTTFSGRDCDLLMLSAPFGASPEDPAAQGLTLLRRLRDQPATPAVVVLATDGNELTAVRALQLGAVDYLPKRLLTPERLNTAVRIALRRVERRVARRLASLANLSRDQARAAAQPAPARPAGAESGEGLAPAGVAALLAAANAEVIPGYVLRLKIGESEKAVVYLASSLQRGHNVALKVSKTLRDEAAGRQFLEREYTAVMAVRSPLVVEIYDYGVHGGFEYLAMEYLPRGDLKARIQRGVSEAEALQLVVQIAEALQVVHGANLVHRDLKPPNVMLRENDGVALIDFGLARPLDGGTVSTQTGVLLGSPYYMSPEQALGEPLDARSDFYSLGIICYEMLTGQKPYTGGTAMEVLQQHVSAPVPVLPADLARCQPFLEKLLAKPRAERFAAAAEIVAAARALLPAADAAPEAATSAA
ncbi:MAG: protein kinase [Gammaproteobacteria bacterium]|nr:protein kinase [Gammaproteobacteria bacterium]MBV9695350.1 protein kinase [Gammaproteobacteria bacterium]